MNNSIAFIKECQRNCLRKTANNGRTSDQIITQYQDSFNAIEKSEKARQVLKNVMQSMARDNQIDSIPEKQQPQVFRRYLRREKIKAYAPWMIGGTLAGAGLGGWIGSNHNHTLLGAVLGGTGGLAVSGVGKWLYERYANDNRFGKVQRWADAVFGTRDQTQKSQENQQ